MMRKLLLNPLVQATTLPVSRLHQRPLQSRLQILFRLKKCQFRSQGPRYPLHIRIHHIVTWCSKTLASKSSSGSTSKQVVAKVLQPCDLLNCARSVEVWPQDLSLPLNLLIVHLNRKSQEGNGNHRPETLKIWNKAKAQQAWRKIIKNSKVYHYLNRSAKMSQKQLKLHRQLTAKTLTNQILFYPSNHQWWQQQLKRSQHRLTLFKCLIGQKVIMGGALPRCVGKLSSCAHNSLKNLLRQLTNQPKVVVPLL